MSNFTFLSEEQIFGDNKLEIFNKRGTIAPITDFAILLGGYYSSDFYYKDEESLENRAGYYWTKTDDKDNDARVVYRNGRRYYDDVHKRDVACRPALPYSSIKYICSHVMRASDGILEVEYGEYPSKAASIELQKNLFDAYSDGRLSLTGKTYTIDSKKYNDYTKGFEPINLTEYEYEGKKYVRVMANTSYGGNKILLSNNEKYKDGDFVWVEVLPVKWLVDEKNDIAVSEKLLFAGVQFKKERNYKGDFESTDIKKYLDDYFTADISLNAPTASNSIQTSNNTNTSSSQNSRKTRIQKLNPDSTSEMQRRNMTDTEIIQNWIESGQSVLLRGPSGIGKTERLKTLYPDLIYIKLTNNMFPEKVVGSTNLQTGQSIPPDFAKQAILSCATEEEKKLVNDNIQNLYDIANTIYERTKDSDKMVVILLDELLNVKPAIQSLVYTLVLNKIVEIGSGLKLPANTVIVATGNQKKYSSVAEDLAEPLEKRFDHILDMEPKVNEWINEYAIPNKVHPSVIGYILSKYKTNKVNINYFYEEPEVGEAKLDKYGCKGRTNDPRGWVSVSNTLYAFEENLKNGKYVGKNVESILYNSINTKLREEWAKEFFYFYNIPTLSVEEVVNGNYTQADLPRDTNERFACVTSLLLADENQVALCREFIKKYCDAEYLKLYDITWIANDEKRAEKIMLLQELSFADDIEVVSKGVGRK